MTNEYNPDWVSPPGETIADLLEEQGYDADYLANLLSLSKSCTFALLEGRLILDERIAAKLSVSLGGKVDFWLAREKQYRESTYTQFLTSLLGSKFHQDYLDTENELKSL